MSAQVLDNLYQAELAVERLVQMGMEVAGVDITEFRPKIWLRGRDEDLRARFGGGIQMIEHGRCGGREVVMAAVFESCQLRWRSE